jgi:3-oxoacyl-[acyl-carrier-protein] synthase-3
MRVRIAASAAAIPPQIVSSREVVQRVKAASPLRLPLPDTLLEMTTGIKERRYIAEHLNASDLAVEAAQKALEAAGWSGDELDLVLWASASQDVSEPATSHIVQKKLGIAKAAMDIKNACNSFINGLQVAEALLRVGQYRKALVVVGETPSRFIRWDMQNRAALVEHLAGFTFGDGGAAFLLEAHEGSGGIFFCKFNSIPEYWDIGGVFAGGSMYTRDLEYSYFRGDASRLNEVFDLVGPELLLQSLEETGLSLDDFARVVLHQVTIPYLNIFLKKTCIPREKIILTLPQYGNMAAASMPVGFAQAVANGEIKRGDKVLFLGIAGGLSLGVMMLEY